MCVASASFPDVFRASRIHAPPASSLSYSEQSIPFSLPSSVDVGDTERLGASVTALPSRCGSKLRTVPASTPFLLGMPGDGVGKGMVVWMVDDGRVAGAQKLSLEETGGLPFSQFRATALLPNPGNLSVCQTMIAIGSWGEVGVLTVEEKGIGKMEIASFVPGVLRGNGASYGVGLCEMRWNGVEVGLVVGEPDEDRVEIVAFENSQPVVRNAWTVPGFGEGRRCGSSVGVVGDGMVAIGCPGSGEVVVVEVEKSGVSKNVWSVLRRPSNVGFGLALTCFPSSGALIVASASELISYSLDLDLIRSNASNVISPTTTTLINPLLPSGLLLDDEDDMAFTSLEVADVGKDGGWDLLVGIGEMWEASGGGAVVGDWDDFESWGGIIVVETLPSTPILQHEHDPSGQPLTWEATPSSLPGIGSHSITGGMAFLEQTGNRAGHKVLAVGIPTLQDVALLDVVDGDVDGDGNDDPPRVANAALLANNPSTTPSSILTNAISVLGAGSRLGESVASAGIVSKLSDGTTDDDVGGGDDDTNGREVRRLETASSTEFLSSFIASAPGADAILYLEMVQEEDGDWKWRISEATVISPLVSSNFPDTSGFNPTPQEGDEWGASVAVLSGAGAAVNGGAYDRMLAIGAPGSGSNGAIDIVWVRNSGVVVKVVDAKRLSFEAGSMATSISPFGSWGSSLSALSAVASEVSAVMFEQKEEPRSGSDSVHSVSLTIAWPDTNDVAVLLLNPNDATIFATFPLTTPSTSTSTKFRNFQAINSLAASNTAFGTSLAPAGSLAEAGCSLVARTSLPALQASKQASALTSLVIGAPGGDSGRGEVWIVGIGATQSKASVTTPSLWGSWKMRLRGDGTHGMPTLESDAAFGSAIATIGDATKPSMLAIVSAPTSNKLVLLPIKRPFLSPFIDTVEPTALSPGVGSAQVQMIGRHWGLVADSFHSAAFFTGPDATLQQCRVIEGDVSLAPDADECAVLACESLNFATVGSQVVGLARSAVCTVPPMPAPPTSNLSSRVLLTLAGRMSGDAIPKQVLHPPLPPSTSCPPWWQDTTKSRVTCGPYLTLYPPAVIALSPPPGLLPSTGGVVVFVHTNAPVRVPSTLASRCWAAYGAPADVATLSVEDRIMSELDSRTIAVYSNSTIVSAIDASHGDLGGSGSIFLPLEGELGFGKRFELYQGSSIPCVTDGSTQWRVGIRVTIGEQECTSVQLLGPHLLSCVSPEATGTDLVVRVHMGSFAIASSENVDVTSFSQTSNPSRNTPTFARRALVSYTQPVVTKVTPRYALVIPNNTAITSSPTALPLTFVIYGSGFGTKQSDIERITVGGGDCGDILWHNSTMLTCSMSAILSFPSAPLPGAVVYLKGGSVSRIDAPSQSAVFQPHGVPVVKDLNPTTGKKDDWVTVFGTGFGEQDGEVVRIEVGGYECGAIRFIRIGAYSCKIPDGSGFDLVVKVTTALGLSSSGGPRFTYNDVPLVRVNFADDSSVPRSVPYTPGPMFAVPFSVDDGAFDNAHTLAKLESNGGFIRPAPVVVVSKEDGTPADDTTCWLSVKRFVLPAAVAVSAVKQQAATHFNLSNSDQVRVDSGIDEIATLSGSAIMTSSNGSVVFDRVSVAAPSGSIVSIVASCRSTAGDSFQTSSSRPVNLHYLATAFSNLPQNTSHPTQPLSFIPAFPSNPIPWSPIRIVSAMIPRSSFSTTITPLIESPTCTLELRTTDEDSTVIEKKSVKSVGDEVWGVSEAIFPVAFEARRTSTSSILNLVPTCPLSTGFILSPSPININVADVVMRFDAVTIGSTIVSTSTPLFTSPPPIVVVPGQEVRLNLSLVAVDASSRQELDLGTTSIPTMPCRVVLVDTTLVALDGATGLGNDGSEVLVPDLRVRAPFGTQSSIRVECILRDGTIISAPHLTISIPAVDVKWLLATEEFRSKSYNLLPLPATPIPILYNTPVKLQGKVIVDAVDVAPVEVGTLAIRCAMRLSSSSSSSVILNGGEADTTAFVSSGDGTFEVTLRAQGSPDAIGSVVTECTLRERTEVSDPLSFQLTSLHLHPVESFPRAIIPSSPGLALPIKPSPVLQLRQDVDDTLIPLTGMRCSLETSAGLTLLGSTSFEASIEKDPFALVFEGLRVAGELGSVGEVEFRCTRSEGDMLPSLSLPIAITNLSTSFLTPPPRFVPSQSPIRKFSIAIRFPKSQALATFDNFTTCSMSLDTSDARALLQAPDVVAAAGIVRADNVVLLGRRGSEYKMQIRCVLGNVPLPLLEHEVQVFGCEIGTEPSSSYACTRCDEGTFSDGGRMECEGCPARGAKCTDGVLSLFQGYYRPPEDRGDVITAKTDLYACPNPDACLVNTTSRTYHCAEAYRATLCGVCVEGFVDAGNGVCARCWAQWASICVVVLVFLCLASAIYYLAIYWRVRRASSSRVILRILLSYTQALGALASFKAPGTKPFRSIISFTEVFSENILALSPFSCTFNTNYISSFYLFLIFPILIALAVMVTAILRIVIVRALVPPAASIARRRTRRTTFAIKAAPTTTTSPRTVSPTSSLTALSFDSQKVTDFPTTLTAIEAYFRSGRATATLLFIAFLAYMPVIKLALRQFACVTVADRTFLRAFLDLECGEGQHIVMQILAAAVLVIFGVGFPAWVVIFLVRSPPSLLKNQVFFARFGFFYDGLRVPYFEAIILIRKGLVILLGAVIEDAVLQSLAAIVLFGTALAIQLQYKPYERFLHNNLEFAALVALSLTQIFGLTYFRADSGGTGNDEALVAGMTVLMVAVNAVVIVALLWYGIAEERKERIGSYQPTSSPKPASKFLIQNPMSSIKSSPK